jgi:SAM-dependent methyltransferase
MIMSVDRNYYVIAGYDLTKYMTDDAREWIYETDEGENLRCYHRPGNIQLFDDLDRNRYLYVGYILAGGDEYDFPTTKFDIVQVEQQMVNVDRVVDRLQEVGVIDCDVHTGGLTYEMIAFEEDY